MVELFGKCLVANRLCVFSLRTLPNPFTGSESEGTKPSRFLRPIVERGSGADGRKGKQLLWREARLCLARGGG